ncbi:N-acetylmuramoyl-L-alanine amidase [Cohnella endophytica]|uniref:N-acetylmuramoyl-L-alanine amidase n=1 Tax=Cohnella endophytica TaxID=2419778 RepID=A0A494XLN4_9BACL|nr:N-acetylmuramoyl-L-alanine amidase [Cohnella endophytica]RKP51607.1 N-acetylmuramoyl-L-alanine amidase [Cohnella endophytica]
MRKNTRNLTIIIASLAIAAILLHNKVEGEASTGTKTIESQGGRPNPSISIVNTAQTPILQGKTIVIDPGHGGKDVGSIGKDDIYEKDITLPTALKLKQELEKTGATVIMTRETDEKLPLEQRVDIANANMADLFISIHFDAYKDSSVSGMTTYYYKKEDESLATLMHDQLFGQSMNAKDRGVHFGDYQVLRDNDRPSLLLELGYISNEQEEKRIRTTAFQEQVSKAIVKGIIACLT